GDPAVLVVVGGVAKGRRPVDMGHRRGQAFKMQVGDKLLLVAEAEAEIVDHAGLAHLDAHAIAEGDIPQIHIWVHGQEIEPAVVGDLPGQPALGAIDKGAAGYRPQIGAHLAIQPPREAALGNIEGPPGGLGPVLVGVAYVVELVVLFSEIDGDVIGKPVLVKGHGAASNFYDGRRGGAKHQRAVG